IQICPVGALTSTAYRFKARPFDVVTTPSVCDHCSAGCTLTVQSRRGEIQRQLARTNMAVNEAWNCDKGRFGFRHLTAATRVTSPLMRDNGELVEASWIQALKKASAAIAAANAEGPGRVAVLTGGRLADEDAYAVSKYARSVLGTDDVDFRTRFAAASETNELAAVAGSPTATYADIEASDVIVVAGIDPEEEVPILYLRLRKAWRNHRARIVVVGPHQGTLADIAWRHVPTGVADEAATLAGLLGAGDGAGADAADALAAAQQVAVVVGERAGAGSITAGRQLASNAAGDNDPVFAYVARRSGARGAIDAGLVSGLLPGGRLLTDESDRGDVAAVWGDLPSTPGRDLHAILADAAAGKIDVLHLIGVDISRDVAASALGRKALEKAGTVIVQDLALTDTAQLADVVLPATARQERAGTATNFEGRAQAFQRAVDAAGLALDDWEIIRQLSAVLGKDLGFDDLAGIRAEMDRLGRRPEPHAHHESVEQSSVEQSDSTATGDEAGAATDAESDSAATAAAAADADGVFAAVVRPLLLDNGTMLTGAADLLATARVAAAQIAPEDAAELGISDGQQLKVNVASGSGNGSVELVAEVTRAVAPGFLALPANSTAPAIIGLVGEDGQLAVTVEALTARDEEVA
ncbi:MAG: molybdopterin-dependent oxidoreductase, partial [Nitriliruptoraceae bacterium]